MPLNEATFFQDYLDKAERTRLLGPLCVSPLRVITGIAIVVVSIAFSVFAAIASLGFFVCCQNEKASMAADVAYRLLKEDTLIGLRHIMRGVTHFCTLGSY